MITIRKLQSADAAEFLKLRLRALREEPLAFGNSYEEEADRTLEDVAAWLPPTENYCYFGAYMDREGLIGLLAFSRSPKRKQHHGGVLYGCYVTPICRSRGVGTRLVSTAIDEARSLVGMHSLQAWIGLHNQEALSLFDKFGFRRSGILPSSLCVDGTFYDEVFLVREVHSNGAVKLSSGE